MPDAITAETISRISCGCVPPLVSQSTIQRAPASKAALAQASGAKRLLFFPAADLDRIYEYPNRHPLRRRGRVDLTAADLAGDGDAKYPLARGLAAWEAVLGPGDAVVFPPRWAHYTESRSLSASLTWRFRVGDEDEEGDDGREF